jgi:hypothetical protein
VSERQQLLIIAPVNKDLPDLPGLPIEVMSLINARVGQQTFTVQLLQGDTIDEAALATKISEQHYDILWFATHGNSEGLALAHGFLGISQLAPYVRTSQAYLVVLNSCESLRIANQLQQECRCDVVSTIGKLQDATAARTAGMFATNLLRTGDPRTAYELSKPGNNQDYVYLTRYKGDTMPIDTYNTSSLPSAERIMAMLDRQQETMRQIEVNLARMEGRLGAVESDMRDIKERLTQSGNGRQTVNNNTWVLIMVAVGLLAIITILLFMAGRT